MEYRDDAVFWEAYRRYLEPVARRVAETIMPLIGGAGGKIDTATTQSGDILTVADDRASAAVRYELKNSPVPVALLDEKEGVLKPLGDREPRIGLIVDELDGTRPFRMGMTTCCVSMAAYPLGEEPLMKNVRLGIIIRLDTGAIYSVVRHPESGYSRVYRNGVQLVSPPDATPFNQACVYLDDAMTDFGLHGLCVRPFSPHVRHGLVRVGSICYGATLMVDRGTQIVLHLGPREYQQWPEVRSYVESIWGNFVTMQSYDIAAFVPLLWECGFTVTNAFGKPLDDVVLDRCVPDGGTIGIVAAANPDLHRFVLREIDRRELFLRDRMDAVSEALDW